MGLSFCLLSRYLPAFLALRTDGPYTYLLCALLLVTAASAIGTSYTTFAIVSRIHHTRTHLLLLLFDLTAPHISLGVHSQDHSFYTTTLRTTHHYHSLQLLFFFFFFFFFFFSLDLSSFILSLLSYLPPWGLYLFQINMKMCYIVTGSVLLLLALTVGLAFGAPRRTTWDKLTTDYSFEDYKREFGRSYDSITEESMRRDVFSRRLATM